jgi:hypothetical protein
MRDKSLTQQQFNIQLEKYLRGKLQMRSFPEELSRIIPNDYLLELQITFPQNFKSLRSLAISHWYLPEILFWEIHLLMEESSFSHLNSKQILEIRILLESKETMMNYLYHSERFTNRELFGNILGNELEILLKGLKIKRKGYPKVKRRIRHRCYRDKGSLRPAHRWLPSEDYSLTEQMNRIERRRYLQQKIIIQIKKILRSISLDKENEF